MEAPKGGWVEHVPNWRSLDWEQRLEAALRLKGSNQSSTDATSDAMPLNTESFHQGGRASLTRGEEITASNEKGVALLQACSQHEWRCAEVLLAGGVSRASINAARDRLGRG